MEEEKLEFWDGDNATLILSQGLAFALAAANKDALMIRPCRDARAIRRNLNVLIKSPSVLGVCGYYDNACSHLSQR